jgi:hypothetical protein
MIARPQLRRGRICQLRALDHQRPRVRLERLPPPRAGREPEALIAVGCAIGFVVTLVIAFFARGCS